MTFIADINHDLTCYIGLFLLIIGLVGSTLQSIIVTTTPVYRNTPSMLYFFVAGIHDFGQMMASLGPYVITAYLHVNTLGMSASWCKLRFFFASSCSAIPLTCCCAASFDQYLITSRSVRVRRWSSMTIARWSSFLIVLVWWLHGSLWLYYQDMSSIVAQCYYKSIGFYLYAIIFVFLILCAGHILIMALFAYLSYRHIKRITATIARSIDRQMVMIVSGQVLLTIVGLTPYGVYVAHGFATINIPKNVNEAEIDGLVNSLTYILCFLPYAVRTSRILSKIRGKFIF